MKFKVTSIAVDLTTSPFGYTAPREEVVDTQEDVLFKDCESIQSVEIAYETFWNYFNNPDVVRNPREKVKVLMVEPVTLN